VSESLTPKQRAFCKHYIENGGDAANAAQLAGYKNPQTQGAENLGKVKITEYINKSRAKKIKDDKDWEIRKSSMDKSHRLIADSNMKKAIKNGAIAGIWNAHQLMPYESYDDEDYYGCPEHHWTDRNDKLFVMRNGLAAKQGLLKKTNGMWLEDIPDLPAYIDGCTCFWEFEYQLEAIAKQYPEVLTQKGKDSITSQPWKIQKIKRAKKKPLTFFQWLFKLIKN